MFNKNWRYLNEEIEPPTVYETANTISGSEVAYFRVTFEEAPLTIPGHTPGMQRKETEMYHDYNPQPAYAHYNYPIPPPWWMQPPPKNNGGKKGKRGNVGKKPTLSDLLKEAIDNRDTLDTIIEKLAKKGDKKDGEHKKEEHKKWGFSIWDTMLLLTIFALPCSLLQLGIAKLVLFGLKVAITN